MREQDHMDLHRNYTWDCEQDHMGTANRITWQIVNRNMKCECEEDHMKKSFNYVKNDAKINL